jgi:hypothetical protein
MKYLKPKSLTWWASLIPVLAGAFVATLPLHGNVSLVAMIDQLTGGTEPMILINAGLAGIGFRGAIA